MNIHPHKTKVYLTLFTETLSRPIKLDRTVDIMGSLQWWKSLQSHDYLSFWPIIPGLGLNLVNTFCPMGRRAAQTRRGAVWLWDRHSHKSLTSPQSRPPLCRTGWPRSHRRWSSAALPPDKDKRNSFHWLSPLLYIIQVWILFKLHLNKRTRSSLNNI